MLNQKKIEIFLAKFRKSPAKQFLEIAQKNHHDEKDTTSRSCNIFIVMKFHHRREENLSSGNL